MRITADIIDDDTFALNLASEKKPANGNDVKNAGDISSVEKEKLLQQCNKVHEMTQKFKNLHVSDIPPSPSLRNKFTVSEIASTRNSMEKAEGDILDLSKKSDIAPSWLLPYLLKMKYEIKQEIINEFLHLPQLKRSAKLSSQSATAENSENQMQFQGEAIHSGIFCDNCDQLIHGVRYKCGNCSDFDLCQECESLPSIHNKNHIFLKIRHPVDLGLYQREKLHQLVMPPLRTSCAINVCGSHQAPPKPVVFEDKMFYEAKFICDDTVPDGTVISPSTQFVKSWKVMNNGSRDWTSATKLHLIQGSPLLVPASERVDVPHLKPEEEGIVSVLFTSPPVPGAYRSHWNFCHRGRPFAHIVWCHIVVKEDKLEEKKADNFAAEKSDKGVENQRKEVASIAQVLTAVKEEHEKGNMVPRKLVVSSHTATPNNTPLDLTPPKSPDHQERNTKELHGMMITGSLKSPYDGMSYGEIDTDGEESSIVDAASVCSTSSDSDAEFVVIPMPKCFNLSESFVSSNITQTQFSPILQTPDIQLDLRTGEETQEQAKAIQKQPTKLYTLMKKTPCNAETVSQETGVPEFLELVGEHTLLEIAHHRALGKKGPISRPVTKIMPNGSSSSETSIIESENCSPVEEHVTPTIDSISIAISSDNNNSEPDVICEVKYPVSESIKDDAQVKENISKENEQEEAPDAPSSATFPKFPIEGISSMYEPSPANLEERTIQVLPEGLVTGALSAAASVYNTARAVISTIQQPRSEREACLSQEPPSVASEGQEVASNKNHHARSLNPMEQLIEMGFCNRQQNEQLLSKHNGDVAMVVAELVNLSDNDWYASRHVPSPPAFFD